MVFPEICFLGKISNGVQQQHMFIGGKMINAPADSENIQQFVITLHLFSSRTFSVSRTFGIEIVDPLRPRIQPSPELVPIQQKGRRFIREIISRIVCLKSCHTPVKAPNGGKSNGGKMLTRIQGLRIDSIRKARDNFLRNGEMSPCPLNW
jgi:hypothetical protein